MVDSFNTAAITILVVCLILMLIFGIAALGYYFWMQRKDEQNESSFTQRLTMGMGTRRGNDASLGNMSRGIALPARVTRRETLYNRLHYYVSSCIRRLMSVPRQPPPPVPFAETRYGPTSSPPRHLPVRNNPQLPERNAQIAPDSLLPNRESQRASSPVFTQRIHVTSKHSTLPNTTRSMSFIDGGLPPTLAPRPVSSFLIAARQSLPIRIDDLENYVETALADGELQRQHRLFPRGQLQPWEYGQLPENKIKNRYGNLLAYDASRVKLALLPGVSYSDYINANYIDGYKSSQFYIATQGPKQNTLDDFWRMICQEKVNSIIMLANIVENGKIKCDKYWPDIAQVKMFGHVKVQTLSEDIYADFTYRKFNVSCGGQTRKMTHLHFTSWPDHGVPRYPQTLAAFAKKVLTLRNTGPIVVHCSAGVGRTGTVILVDICLRMASQEKQVDPLGYLQRMRYQRANLVDNAEQYELVHLVLLDCLLTDTFSFPCAKFKSELEQLLANKNRNLSEHYDRINQLSTRDSLRIRRNDVNDWPQEKNRFQGIVPSNYGRVILCRPMGGSEYINAVYVDGFRTKEQFIATQLPLPDTVADLWHLVTQVKTTLIIVLNQPDPMMDRTSCVFWPEGRTKLQLPDCSCIVMQHQTENDMCKKFFFKRYGQDKVEGRPVTTEQDIELLMLKNWRAGKELALTADEILDLWQDTQRHYRSSGPIITMCHDGARACGLFLASVFVVEKMKLEKEVDVGLAVRSVRLTRPHFITSLNQFAFLHYVARTYLEKYETYANFQ